MFIEFVKDHFSGIPKGTIQEVSKNDAARLVGSNFAKETTQKAFDTYVSTAEDRKAKAVQAVEVEQEKKAKAAKKEEDAIRVKVKKQLEDRIVKAQAQEKEAVEAAQKQADESAKVAAEKAAEIAKENEESRIKALTEKIMFEEEGKIKGCIDCGDDCEGCK